MTAETKVALLRIVLVATAISAAYWLGKFRGLEVCRDDQARLRAQIDLIEKAQRRVDATIQGIYAPRVFAEDVGCVGGIGGD